MWIGSLRRSLVAAAPRVMRAYSSLVAVVVEEEEGSRRGARIFCWAFKATATRMDGVVMVGQDLLWRIVFVGLLRQSGELVRGMSGEMWASGVRQAHGRLAT